MKKLGIIILLVSILSCNKKELKVPKISLQGSEKIANNSIIWMFYGDNGKLDLNEKNRISSTNWFFNIDKKLTLKEVIPEVIRLIDKHNTKSPHNTAPMSNYYSYINAINDHMSFYAIDSITYLFPKNTLNSFAKDTVHIKINALPLIIPKIEGNAILQPVFNGNLSFQDYLEAKAELETKLSKEKISRFEYIVN